MLTCISPPPPCDLLHKDEPVSVPFPSVRAVEMVDSLTKNFKVRFNNFRSHGTNTCTSEDPFSTEVSEVPENLSIPNCGATQL
jgi:hypothetical protein